MIATRLCYQAGRLDVERWLTEPDTPRILNWWEAYERINPLPDPWVQTATICQELAKLRATLVSCHGGKVSPEDIETWRHYMPPRFVAPIEEPRTQSAEDQRKVVERWATK